MSKKSQTNNMRRLAALLDFDLCDIHGKKECGPNGSKQVFLNAGKVFLRALARDLGLRDVTVSSNAGGIGVFRHGWVTAITIRPQISTLTWNQTRRSLRETRCRAI